MDVLSSAVNAAPSVAASAVSSAAAGGPGELHTIVWVIVVTAGFGGLVHGMMRKDDPKWQKYSLVIPFSDKTRVLGFLGDIAVGVAAGVSIFFVGESLLGLRLDGALSANDFLRLVALGVICGYLGPNLLDQVSLVISTKLLKSREAFEKEKEELAQLKTKVEQHSKVEKLIFLGNAYRKWKVWDQALTFYDLAADKDPSDPNPLIQKSVLYAEKADDTKDPSLYDLAISYANKALQVDKMSWRAYYNSACYKCQAGRPAADVLSDLKSALSIDTDGYLPSAARNDPDLKNVQDNKEFQALVGAVSPAQGAAPSA